MTEIQSIDDEENDSFVLLILWYIKCSSAGEEDGFSPLYDGNESPISSGSSTVRSGSYSVSSFYDWDNSEGGRHKQQTNKQYQISFLAIIHKRLDNHLS